MFVADFIFAWGGRRGIKVTVNYKKKPPSPPTITVENFYFYIQWTVRRAVVQSRDRGVTGSSLSTGTALCT